MEQRGFGLVQLLVGITLIAIVAQFATPGFTPLIEAQRRDDAARQLASGIRSARTEAIMRNQVVLIHAIDDDWSLGWRMIVDHNGEGAGDERNPVLMERASSGRVTIVGNRTVKRFVRFNGLGTPLHASGGFFAGTLHVCDTKQSTSHYQVVLSKTGRVSLRNDKAENTLCRPV